MGYREHRGIRWRGDCSFKWVTRGNWIESMMCEHIPGGDVYSCISEHPQQRNEKIRMSREGTHLVHWAERRRMSQSAQAGGTKHHRLRASNDRNNGFGLYVKTLLLNFFNVHSF